MLNAIIRFSWYPHFCRKCNHASTDKCILLWTDPLCRTRKKRIPFAYLRFNFQTIHVALHRVSLFDTKNRIDAKRKAVFSFTLQSTQRKMLYSENRGGIKSSRFIKTCFVEGFPKLFEMKWRVMGVPFSNETASSQMAPGWQESIGKQF